MPLVETCPKCDPKKNRDVTTGTHRYGQQLIQFDDGTRKCPRCGYTDDKGVVNAESN